MSTLRRIRLRGVPTATTSRDTQRVHCLSKRKHKETQGRKTLQYSNLDGSSAGHRSHTPSRADVWVGMWSPYLRQLIKTRFENSNRTYTNALTSLSEKQLAVYREALKDLSTRGRNEETLTDTNNMSKRKRLISREDYSIRLIILEALSEKLFNTLRRHI